MKYYLRVLVALVIIATFAIGVAVCFGQTNVVPVVPVTPPATTGDDIAKVLTDFGINASWAGILKIVLTAFFAARISRKAIPNSAQTGKFGTLLKHVALEKIPAVIHTSAGNLVAATPPKA